MLVCSPSKKSLTLRFCLWLSSKFLVKVFLNEGFALLLVVEEDEVLTNAAVGSLIWNVKLWSSEGWAFKIDFTTLLPEKIQVK